MTHELLLMVQFSTFIMAAHDTTTSAVSHTLYILSRNQDIQTKLREEIAQARREHGDPDYETLMALPLLDAVCRETLRIHPPATHINRMYVLLWYLYMREGANFEQHKQGHCSSVTLADQMHRRKEGSQGDLSEEGDDCPH